MDLAALTEWTFFGNTVLAWIITALVAALTFGALLLVKRIALRQLRPLTERVETNFAPIAIATVRSTRQWFLLLVALRAGSLALVLPLRVVNLLGVVVVVGVVVQLAIWVNVASKSWLSSYTDRTIEEDAASVTTMRAVVFLARVLAWSVVLIVALDNLGINITALIAGLGVGGIAVALALQNILGDLFASLSIVIDKPFVVGDFIIVGEHLGTVAHIGLKSTRLTSLSGEQLVFGNTDLLSSRIRNFKRMNERRIVFGFGVIYQTPHEMVEMIPGMVREIVEAQDLARFDRAHFKEFGASSLNFEVVYHVLVPDFNSYMDVQQAINLALFRCLAEHGVKFAYPTQTLYLNEQSQNGETHSHDDVPAEPGASREAH